MRVVLFAIIGFFALFFMIGFIASILDLWLHREHLEHYPRLRDIRFWRR